MRAKASSVHAQITRCSGSRARSLLTVIKFPVAILDCTTLSNRSHAAASRSVSAHRRALSAARDSRDSVSIGRLSLSPVIFTKKRESKNESLAIFFF